MYVNPLLVELKRNAIGAHEGTIYFGSLAAANDVLFMENCHNELKTMFNMSKVYARER